MDVTILMFKLHIITFAVFGAVLLLRNVMSIKSRVLYY